MSIINSASTNVTSRVAFKSAHPYGGQPSSVISLTVSSGSSGALGTARWVLGHKIRVSVSNASDSAVVAKFTAPFKMELIDWAIITKVAGSGPTVSLTRANDVIASMRPVSTASSIRQAQLGTSGVWKLSNTVVESGSIVRLAITQSHVYDFVNVLSYRPMA
jgi:hypothetical protein